jgi:hypothetical protein
MDDAVEEGQPRKKNQGGKTDPSACGVHNQVVSTLERLVDRHGDGNYADYTIKLTFPRNANGLYLVKGGGPDVWRKIRSATQMVQTSGHHIRQALRHHRELDLLCASVGATGYAARILTGRAKMVNPADAAGMSPNTSPYRNRRISS